MSALLVALALWLVGSVVLGALMALAAHRLNHRWTGGRR